MIGKIIGGLAGAQAAEYTSKLSGPGGALLGAASVAMLRRLSIPALIALSVGGYAFSKMTEKGKGATATTPGSTTSAA